MDMGHTSFDEEHCVICHNQFDTECPSIEVGEKGIESYGEVQQKTKQQKLEFIPYSKQ